MAIQKVKLCHTTLYEPHVTNYENNVTYIEFLLGVLKKLNETIEQVNSNTQFIEEFDEKYQDLTARLIALENAVNVQLPEQINIKIENAMSILRSETEIAIVNSENRLTALLNSEVERLDDKIEGITIGKIYVIDPTTGITSPLQEVLDNMAGASKEEALTAEEYDDLELTATAYDAYSLTAYEYDYKGKSLLV